MSRITRYLKQQATLELVRRDVDGKVELDRYGQPTYAEPITVVCRKEPYVTRGSSKAGFFANFSTTYYLDETHVLSTSLEDMHNKYIGKLDGSQIAYVSEYRDGAGRLVGYEVQV